ncbi:MAG: hypothetical protein IPJ37_17440 [Bacteroidales bacterium]|nr:hypothetical protein [Bacteroidales bacterium]
MIEKPYDGRAKIDFDGLRLKILIPTKKNWFIIIFLMAWTGGWYMGESSAIKELLSSKNIAADSFTIFWLIGWTVGGLFAITILVWSLFGWELIYIDSGIFKVEKGILNLRLIKKS